MRASKKEFDETKYISFLIKDDELLKTYTEIWGKVKECLKRKFYSESLYNKKS